MRENRRRGDIRVPHDEPLNNWMIKSTLHFGIAALHKFVHFIFLIGLPQWRELNGKKIN